MPASIFPIPASSGSSVPNWTLVTSSTPSGVATVTFSGLSGYAKYRIVIPGITLASASNLNVRLNADSAANYSHGFSGSTNTSTFFGTSSIGSTNFTIGNAQVTATVIGLTLEIDNCLVLVPKTANGTMFNGSGGTCKFDGAYQTTSLITSITVTNTATANFTAGSIYLEGAN